MPHACPYRIAGLAQLDTDILGGEKGKAGLHVSQEKRIRYCGFVVTIVGVAIGRLPLRFAHLFLPGLSSIQSPIVFQQMRASSLHRAQ